MKIPESAERKSRKIGGKNEAGAEFEFTVALPVIFAEGQTLELTPGIANALNQIVFENVSNNLRATLGRGFETKAPADGKKGEYRPYTPEEAQAKVDAYLAEYDFGVRTGGGGARVTDPVEREARNIAGQRVEAFLAEKGIKRKDVKFSEMRDKLFDKNKDALMAEAKRIVAARTKAIGGTEGLMDELLDFLPGVASTGGDEPVPTGEGAQA